ncbi:T9SS type A sorting domain-containing protein [Pontimicrobium sp. MEBiC06410]
MKKILFLAFFVLSYITAQSQCNQGNCQDIQVSNTQQWSDSHGTPSWGSNSVWLWSYYSGFTQSITGEGVNYSGYNFVQGEQYCVSFNLDAATNTGQIPNVNSMMNVVLTSNAVVGNTGTNTNNVIPNTPTPNQTIMGQNIWANGANSQMYTFNFTATQNFNNIWFYPTNPSAPNPQIEVRISNLSICQPCTPDPTTITIDGTDVTDTLEYTIPCGTTCINISATNLQDDAYNTNSPVLTDLNGLFCLTNNSTLTSFVANITGTDSCGDFYSQNVTINIEQDCPPPPCCDAENNLLVNGDFNQATCGGNGAFNNGCVPNWIATDGSPSINNFSADPNAWMWSYGGNGEGIAANFDFEEGVSYSICFRIRTDDRNSGDPNVANNATVNLVATNSVGNITATPTGEYIFNDTMGGYLNTWTDISLTYTPNGNYSQLWVFPFMANASNGVSQAELSIDDIIISVCESCETTAPTNLQVVGNTLTWDPVPGATSYVITSPPGNVPQIDCGCTGSNGISLAPITVGTNSYTLPASLQDMCFVWQVTAICEDGTESPISNQACHTPKEKECEVTAPTNLQVVGNTLTWDPVPGATSYTITSPPGNVPQIDCGCTGNNGISLAPITVGTNSYTLPTSLQNKCFVWQVTAICESGKKSPISNQACHTPKEKECEVTAPTNLQVVGTTLTWNPVPGATSYIISSPAGNVPQIDCGCEFGISIAPVQVNTNSYTLPASLEGRCFVWQVTAVCESGKKSPISRQACYNKGKKGRDADKISIYPNPNKGNMDIKLNIEDVENIQLNIYSFDGTLIKTLENRKVINGELKFNLNLRSSLTKGVYFFSFNTGENIITKKVMIE